MKHSRWDVFERAVTFTLGCALAICEAAFWGGRPSTYTFIGTVLLGSAALRRLNNKKDQDS